MLKRNTSKYKVGAVIQQTTTTVTAVDEGDSGGCVCIHVYMNTSSLSAESVGLGLCWFSFIIFPRPIGLDRRKKAYSLKTHPLSSLTLFLSLPSLSLFLSFPAQILRPIRLSVLKHTVPCHSVFAVADFYRPLSRPFPQPRNHCPPPPHS